MAVIKFNRATALPGTLEANTIYLIAPPGKPNYTEMYVTGNSPSAIKRMINEDDINAMITGAIASANELTVLADITARDALTPTKTMYVYVQDATGDASVAAGGATYLWNVAGSAWIKVSEAENLDVVVTWSSLSGRPTSSAANIDDAVAKAHTHSNKTQLDKIDQDAGGNFTYGGVLPHAGWDNTEW